MPQNKINLQDMTPEEKARCLCDVVNRQLIKSHNKDHVERITELNHIRDWITSSCLNSSYWLENVNELGVPKKIAKLHSIDVAVAEANKAMKAENQRLLNKNIIRTNDSVLMTLDNGYYVVQLMTPEELDSESVVMQHCIGHGSYDQKIRDVNNYRYYSLRDPAGNPHVTMETKLNLFNGFSISEIQGKQNKAPIEKYLNLLLVFLAEHKINCTEYYKLFKKLKDIHGTWCSIEELPENFYCEPGYISDWDYDLPEGFILDSTLKINMEGKQCNIPDNVKIYNLYVYADVCNLGENICIKNNLSLVNCKKVNFPRSIQIAETLVINPDLISSLNPYQKIDSLHITNYNGLSPTKIPLRQLNYVRLNTHLDTYEVLNENLIIHESLNLYSRHNKNRIIIPEIITSEKHTALTSLQNIDKPLSIANWKIGGEITIKKSNIFAMPKIFKGSNFCITDSIIDNLPEEIHLGNQGLFSINNSIIHSFPKTINMDSGVISFKNTDIEEIPEGCIPNFKGLLQLSKKVDTLLELSGVSMYPNIPNDLDDGIIISVFSSKGEVRCSPDEYRARFMKNDYDYHQKGLF